MKLSLVTISYNQASFLARLFLSIDQNRADADIEHIVVDPGSTDGSREVIERRGDRVDTCVFEPDFGPSDGLNKGVAKCTGEVFAYVNADDWLLPGAAAHALSIFANDPELDVLYGSGFTADQSGELTRHYPAPRRLRPRAVALGASFPMQQSCFFRRDALGADPFNVHNRIAWDTELILRLLMEGKRFRRTSENLGVFTLHAGGITGSGSHYDAIRAEHHKLYETYLGHTWNQATTFEYHLLRYLKAARTSLRQPSVPLSRLRNLAGRGKHIEGDVE